MEVMMVSRCTRRRQTSTSDTPPIYCRRRKHFIAKKYNHSSGQCTYVCNTFKSSFHQPQRPTYPTPVIPSTTATHSENQHLPILPSDRTFFHSRQPSTINTSRRRWKIKERKFNTFVHNYRTPFTILHMFVMLYITIFSSLIVHTNGQASPASTIHAPAQSGSGAVVRFPFDFDFTLPVAAVSGSVKLRLNVFTDGTAERVLVLGAAAEAIGRKTVSIGQMTSPGAGVVSVAPATDIGDTHQALLMLEYMADDGSTIAHTNFLGVLTFDLITVTPTLAVSSVGGKIPENFQFVFGLSEVAKAGSVKLKITPEAGGAATDTNGVRTLVLSSAYETVSSTHTVTMTKLSIASAALSAIDSVNPSTDLVSGSQYSMVIEYQDQIGNPVAASTAVTGIEMDTSTLVPSLINPSIAGIASVPVFFNLTYILPEQANTGSVELKITPVIYGAYANDQCATNGNQATTRTIVLGTAYESAQFHSLVFRPLDQISRMIAENKIVSTIPANMCNLTDGATYNFRISYRDTTPNPAASDEQIIVFDSIALSVQLTSPTGNAISPPIFDVQFTLQEEANVGTVQLVFSRTGGVTDNFGDRYITFINTIKDATSYTVGIVSLSTAANDVAEIASVSPSNDLVHGAIYEVYIVYNDRAGNVGYSNVVTGLQIDAQTEAPILTSPGNNFFIPTNFPVTFRIPEQALANSVKIRFTKTATFDLGEGIEYYDYHEIVFGGLTTPTNGDGSAVTLNIPALSTVVASLTEASSLVVSPATGSESASDLDLTHGTTYSVTIEYIDLRNNPKATATSTGIEFSADTTVPPTLISPANLAALKTIFNIQYTLPEPALFSGQGGDMRLNVVTIGTDRDSVTLRTIRFSEGSVALDRGTHSITIPAGGISNIASDVLVQSISDTTALVDGTEYEFQLFYEDRAGNPTVNATSSVSFHADATLPPVVTSPSSGSCLTTTFDLSFRLDEKGKSGTLQSTFTLASSSLVPDAAAPRVITFADSVLSRGTHQIASGNMQAFSSAGGLSQITSIVPATDLVDGAKYDATLQYKDAADNALNVVNFPGTTFYFGGQTTQQHGMTIGGGGISPASSGTIALGANWIVGIYLPEPALSGSLTLTIARSDGVVDPNSPHIITFGVDLEAQSTLAVGAAGLNDPSKHVETTITSLSGLTSAQPSNKISSVTSNGGTAQDMKDGSLYRFTLSYQDCSGNTAVTVIRNLIAFAGSATLPPDLAMASLIASPFGISFQTREKAATGTLKLIVSYAGGFIDDVPTRTIVFTALYDEPSLYSLSLGDFSGLVAAQSTKIASVTPATDLVDGAEYNFVLSMQDAAGNDAATDFINGVYFAGSATRPPRLYTPDSGETIVQAFTILMFIAERAKAGTVKLTFSRTGGSVDNNGDRVVVLTSAFESYGNHTFTLGALSTAASIQSEVSTVNPAINLVHLAVYSVTLTYQDLLSNPIASHTVTGVTHDIFTESMDLFEPTTGTSIKDIFQLRYTLGENALAGSLKMTAAYVSGINDAHGDRSVILNTASAGTSGGHTFNMVALSGAAAALTEVDSVSPATDLVDGATYNFALEYQDLFSNTKQVRTQNGVIFAGATTLPAIMLLPLATVKVPQDFVVKFTIQEIPKPNTLELLVHYTGVGTNDPNNDRVITFVSSVQQVGTHIITLNAISKLLLKVPECVSVTPAEDLINGARYDVSIRYQDSASNPQTTTTVSSVEFDIVTDVPTISAPASGNIKVNYTLTLVVPENAMPNTIRVEFNPISGDAAATRVVHFDSSLNTAGTHSIEMTNLTNLGIPKVFSVAPRIDLVHMAQYIVTMVYRDAIENAEATSGSVLMTHDTHTESPFLVLPAPGIRFKEAFLFDFTLPEIAKPGTVKITFTRTGGTADSSNPRVVTFAGVYESAARHANGEFMNSFSTSVGTVSYIASIVPDADLVHMTEYEVRLDYQDTANNIIASAIHLQATFDTVTETPTQHAPADQAYPITTFLMDFTIPEQAKPESVTMTIVPISGGEFNDPHGSRFIRFNSSVEVAGRHTFNMAKLSTVVADVTEVRFVVILFLCVSKYLY
jgi:hypothetical protein